MRRLSTQQRNLINAITFNGGWFVCVIGASRGFEWVAPLCSLVAVVIHLTLTPHRRPEFMFLLVCTLIGTAVDTSLIRLHLFEIQPPTEFAPLWLISIWAMFSISFESLAIFSRLPGLMFALGAITGPLSYFAGESFELLHYQRPLWTSLVAHGLLWGCLMLGLSRARRRCYQMLSSHNA